MSRFQRATVYDKTTGKYLGKGGAEDPRILQAKRDGHIVVDGSKDELTMWDFGAGEVVADLDKEMDRQRKEQDEKQWKADRQVSRQWLIDNDVTGANVVTAVQHLQTLAVHRK